MLLLSYPKQRMVQRTTKRKQPLYVEKLINFANRVPVRCECVPQMRAHFPCCILLHLRQRVRRRLCARGPLQPVPCSSFQRESICLGLDGSASRCFRDGSHGQASRRRRWALEAGSGNRLKHLQYRFLFDHQSRVAQIGGLTPD